MTKSQQLAFYCKDKGTISKSEIMKWGIDNYFISADRVVRKFVETGRMQKIPREEAILNGLKGKQAWYRWDINREVLLNQPA